MNEMMSSLVLELADKVTMICIIGEKRKKRLLREGGAIKIQRCFRLFRDSVLAEEKRAEEEERQRTLEQNIHKWTSAIRVSIRIYNLLIRLRDKHCKRRGFVKRSVMRSALEHFLLKLKDARIRSQLAHLQSISIHSTGRQKARLAAYKEREKAAMKLQLLGRAVLSKRILRLRRHRRYQLRLIQSFLIRVIYLFRRRKKMRIVRAAIVIQKRVRGMLWRAHLCRRVEAGMLLNAAWRKYRAIRTLKQNLRRVERPAKIVLRGLRHIPQAMIHTDHLRVKVQELNPHDIGPPNIVSFF